MTFLAVCRPMRPLRAIQVLNIADRPTLTVAGSPPSSALMLGLNSEPDRRAVDHMDDRLDEYADHDADQQIRSQHAEDRCDEDDELPRARPCTCE